MDKTKKIVQTFLVFNTNYGKYLDAYKFIINIYYIDYICTISCVLKSKVITLQLQ